MTLKFLDTEFTNLDPRLAEVFEVAIADEEGPVRSWLLPHSLATADPKSLEVNGYFERFGSFGPPVDEIGPHYDVLLKKELEGATLVCSNPPADREVLFRRWGVAPWHHRSIDISTYAMPILGHDKPMGLFAVANELRERGVAIPEPDHTAAADVECLRRCFLVLRTLVRYPQRMVTGMAPA